MKADEFEKKFESGEDITRYLDLSKARRRGQEQKRVNVDFPVWMIHSLDKEARRLGVARQALIKVLIAQHLERTPPYSRSAHDAEEKR
jgi:macrodomain Ter protein organizer (MatP/YcbG family)